MRNTRNFQLRHNLPLHRVIGSIMLLTILGASALHTSPTGAEPAQRSLIHGVVRDQQTQRGIAGAHVELGTINVVTDAEGRIPATPIAFDGPIATLDVQANKAGYAPWRYLGVELASNHPIELQIELGDQPITIEPAPPTGSAAVLLDGPPEYINVGRTFNTTCVYPQDNVQRVDRVRFIDYVQNVLPNEWVASWPAASLDAGAVAVSQYAWSVAFMQRKWTGRGLPFDVLDSTCDQVYKDRDPARNYAATDAAVNRMWGTALLRSSTMITTFYRAKDEQCGTNLDCMGQVGSRDRAAAGASGLQILRYYYSRKAAVQDVPPYRATLPLRSADLSIKPGETRSLSVQMCNGGTYRWQQNMIALRTLDPQNSANSAYVSPFADASWIDQQHPATISETSVFFGQRGTWQFTIAVPATLPLGTYQLAVQPTLANDATLVIDQPVVWTITVTDADPPVTSPQAWLPRIDGNVSVGGCS